MLAALPVPAMAEEGAGSNSPNNLVIKPILDARLRYEAVDQGSLDADAVTLITSRKAVTSIGPNARR